MKMSGQLFRKPRRHATFKRCDVMLTGGKLLIFRSALRSRNGVEMPHIHQELETSIDLADCYIYSGLLTDSDLLYANQTFDNSNPGHHSLPRAYLSPDLFTTRDDDTAITFVVWQPLRKNYFRSREYGKRGKTKQTLNIIPICPVISIVGTWLTKAERSGRCTAVQIGYTPRPMPRTVPFAFSDALGLACLSQSP